MCLELNEEMILEGGRTYQAKEKPSSDTKYDVKLNENHLQLKENTKTNKGTHGLSLFYAIRN